MILEIAGLSLLVLTGAFLLWPIVKAALKQQGRKSWPQVTGTVLEHRRREVRGGAHAEFLVRYNIRGAKREVLVDSADGLPYQQSDEFRSTLDAVIEKRHGRYPVGSEIPLRVDPDRSDHAHIRDREMPMAVIAFVVAAVFLVFLAIAIRVMFL